MIENMTIKEKAEKIKYFIEREKIDIFPSEEDLRREQSNHMGARIIYSVLLNELSYRDELIEPMIKLVIEKCHGEKVDDFKFFYDKNNLKDIIPLIEEKKEIEDAIKKITELFIKKGIDVKKDLIKLLKENQDILEQNGIEHKTSQYLKKGLDMPAVIISINIENFLRYVDISYVDEKEAEEILKETANMLNVKENVLDSSIWSYARKYIKKGRANLNFPRPARISILGEVSDKGAIRRELTNFFSKYGRNINDWKEKFLNSQRLKRNDYIKKLK